MDGEQSSGELINLRGAVDSWCTASGRCGNSRKLVLGLRFFICISREYKILSKLSAQFRGLLIRESVG